MRIEVTVRHGGAASDVAISAPAPVPLSAFAAELARTVGGPADAGVWSGDVLLAADAQLGAAGLRTGAVLNVGGPHRAHNDPGVLALHQVGGPDAGRVVPVGRGRIVVGRAADCDLVVADPDVSRRHAVIEVSAAAITVRDAGSTNGTYVEGRLVGAGGRRLRPGDVLRVGDTSLAVAGPTLTPAAVAATGDGTVRVLRPPRSVASAPGDPIEVPTRTSATRPRGVQWVAALVPALAGGAIAWTTRSPQFLLFALLSPLMMLSSSLGDRLHWRRSRRRDAVSYGRRRAAADAEIHAALAAETVARRVHHPDPAAVLRLVVLPGSRLWERRRGDDDLLHVAVGTAELPSARRTRQGPVVVPAGMVRDVPLTLDLRRGPIGLAGPRERVAGLARWILGQLAVLHAPAEVELSLLIGPGATAEWEWARWLPHLRGRTATDADEWATLVADLAAVVEHRSSRQSGEPGVWAGSWHVLVVDRASRLSGVSGLATVLDRGWPVGITALCLDDDVTGLPTACRAVVQIAGDTGTRALVRSAVGVGAGGGANSGVEVGYDSTVVRIDTVSVEWGDTVARRLAPLVSAADESADGVPGSCGLLDTLACERGPRTGEAPGPPPLSVSALHERWARGGGGAATALGRGADGALIVDLVADGPHALVAGTTGAGKSELLQSLVAGLAANHSPVDINFLLIDYKGGAAFAECAQLPHTAAVVTDLDGYLTERALRSLRSELRSREQLFAAAGVTDLAGYRRTLAGEALPRLVIVVDEFAALAEELPDFVSGLVGVAQRGRSLGVHLVLATQRPGRAVSPEIRANTSLRVALRMTDAGESSDVIDSPVAATIERSRAGRAYLRAGPTLTCFQTAYAATPVLTAASVRVERLAPWRRAAPPSTPTDNALELSRLVTALRAAAACAGCPPARRLWQPPLPEYLPRTDLPRPAHPTAVAIGLVDRPDDQRQPNLEIDLGSGSSVLVAGAARTGRTSVLASLLAGALERFGPHQLSVYVVDPAGALSRLVHDLPHVATALGPDDLGSVPTLLRRLNQVCSRASGGPGGSPGVLSLVLVDGWDAVLAAMPDVEAVDCADALANLLRAGPAAAMTTLVTGDRSVLAPRSAAGFSEKIVLALADRTDFGLLGLPPRAVPPTMPPGRAVRGSDGAVVQLAHAGAAPGLADAARALADLVARDEPAGRSASVRPHAVRLRPLPRQVSLAALPRRVGSGQMLLGLAGDRAEPVHVDLFAGAGRVLVAGPPRSGRSTVLRSLLAQSVATGLSTLVAAGARSPLRALAGALAVPVLDPAAGVEAIGAAPRSPTLLLVDDCENLLDTAAGDALTGWLHTAEAPLAAVVAGRADDLATTYRGLGAQVRRANCGLLLRPGPVDGEILGVRLPRRASSGPPGRGVLVGDPSWGAAFDDGEPMPIQVAQP